MVVGEESEAGMCEYCAIYGTISLEGLKDYEIDGVAETW
jgi:hypothetical protein